MSLEVMLEGTPNNCQAQDFLGISSHRPPESRGISSHRPPESRGMSSHRPPESQGMSSHRCWIHPIVN